MRDLAMVGASYGIHCNQKHDFYIVFSLEYCSTTAKFKRYFSYKTGKPFPGDAKHHHLL